MSNPTAFQCSRDLSWFAVSELDDLCRDCGEPVRDHRASPAPTRYAGEINHAAAVARDATEADRTLGAVQAHAIEEAPAVIEGSAACRAALDAAPAASAWRVSYLHLRGYRVARTFDTPAEAREFIDVNAMVCPLPGVRVEAVTA